ncbi:MAG: thioredoxin family protein [Paracoccaceae bacterium]
MATTSTTPDAFGLKAPDFALPATDGNSYGIGDLRGVRGLVVVFICNHCPYVIGIAERLVQDAAALHALGFGFVAINANDAKAYPDDSFENMKLFAHKHSFNFPYLYDADQSIARAYGAVCTPDFFGYDAHLGLQYRGRIDRFGRNPRPQGEPSELLEAMRHVSRTGQGPEGQMPSIGCSIKWRDA